MRARCFALIAVFAAAAVMPAQRAQSAAATANYPTKFHGSSLALACVLLDSQAPVRVHAIYPQIQVLRAIIG